MSHSCLLVIKRKSTFPARSSGAFIRPLLWAKKIMQLEKPHFYLYVWFLQKNQRSFTTACNTVRDGKDVW